MQGDQHRRRHARRQPAEDTGQHVQTTGLGHCELQRQLVHIGTGQGVPDALEVTLGADDGASAAAISARGIVPVTLESRVTEIGTLELWCNAKDGDQRWKLELNIRHNEDVGTDDVRT